MSKVIGCFVLLVLSFVPGLIVAYFTHSSVWILAGPPISVVLMLILAALPLYRRVTPQEWGGQLEKFLLGTDGAWDFDDVLCVRLADKRLENLRSRIVSELINPYKWLDTAEKREEFKQIVDALKRGEIPS